MAHSADAVQNGLVLRLSIAGSRAFAGVAAEMAVKLAEQLGLDTPDASRAGEAIADLARDLGRSEAEDITYEFRTSAGELIIQASQGGHVADVRFPISG